MPSAHNAYTAVSAASTAGPEHNVADMDREWKQWSINGPVEAEAGNDDSQVSACSHQMREAEQAILRDKNRAQVLPQKPIKVTGASCQGPGKEVSQAKCSRQGRSLCRSHVEVDELTVAREPSRYLK